MNPSWPHHLRRHVVFCAHSPLLYTLIIASLTVFPSFFYISNFLLDQAFEWRDYICLIPLCLQHDAWHVTDTQPMLLEKPRQWDETLGPLPVVQELAHHFVHPIRKQKVSNYFLLLSELFGGKMKEVTIVWIEHIYFRNYKVLANFKSGVDSVPFLYTKNLKRENIF